MSGIAYADGAGEWRWSLWHRSNGREVAAVTVGYRRRVDLVANLRLLFGDRLDLGTLPRRGAFRFTVAPA